MLKNLANSEATVHFFVCYGRLGANSMERLVHSIYASNKYLPVIDDDEL